jgi:hypothetical protein
MKKLFLVLSMLAVVGTANAQWHHHGGYYRGGGYYQGGNWVAPLIIGGVAGAIIARESQPVIVQQPPVVVQQQPIYVQRQPVCTEWKEIQHPDGQIYRERTCSQ